MAEHSPADPPVGNHLPGVGDHSVGSGASTPAATAPLPFPYIIRPATHADVDGIVRVGRKVWVETFSHTTSPENISQYLDSSYRPDLISRDVANPHFRYLVACPSDKPDEVAAFAVLATDSVEPSVADWPNPIELQRIYVDSPHHGAGLARRIAEAVYELGRKEGYESMWLGVLPENIRAVKFYEKCGFRKVGSHEFWVGGQLDMDESWLDCCNMQHRRMYRRFVFGRDTSLVLLQSYCVSRMQVVTSPPSETSGPRES